jgi:hypothetical protein
MPARRPWGSPLRGRRLRRGDVAGLRVALAAAELEAAAAALPGGVPPCHLGTTAPTPFVACHKRETKERSRRLPSRLSLFSDSTTSSEDRCRTNRTKPGSGGTWRVTTGPGRTRVAAQSAARRSTRSRAMTPGTARIDATCFAAAIPTGGAVGRCKRATSLSAWTNQTRSRARWDPRGAMSRNTGSSWPGRSDAPSVGMNTSITSTAIKRTIASQTSSSCRGHTGLESSYGATRAARET